MRLKTVFVWSSLSHETMFKNTCLNFTTRGKMNSEGQVLKMLADIWHPDSNSHGALRETDKPPSQRSDTMYCWWDRGRTVSQGFISFNSSRSAPSWLTLAFLPSRESNRLPRSRLPSHADNKWAFQQRHTTTEDNSLSTRVGNTSTHFMSTESSSSERGAAVIFIFRFSLMYCFCTFFFCSI